MAVLKIRDKNGNIIPIPAIKGENGKSAYEIAVDHGFEGTEEEWLESLKGSDIVMVERPTEIKEFLNDFAAQANSDISGVSSSLADLILFKAIKDDSFDYSGKEIKKIEYSFDNGNSWVNVYDFAIPTLPCVIQAHKSTAYKDDSFDMICFGSIYFPAGMQGCSQYINDILFQNQYGFRVTYYTD